MTMLSRRTFSQTIAGSIAAAFTGPSLKISLAFSPVATVQAASPILLNYNENPYGPTPKARAALANCAAIANRYPDAAAKELKAALAKKHNVAPENIALGCGSTEILKCADAAFLAPQSNLVAPLPTFEAVLEYAQIGGASSVTVPSTPEHGHDLKKMAAACTSKTGVVYVCNPNNPTGTYVTHDDLATFIAAVPLSTLVLIDEAYFELADAPGYATAIDFIPQHPNVLVARTFSKVYGMAGMRLGYGVGSPATIDMVSRHLVQDSINAAAIAAARASLDDPEGVAASREKLVHTRQWLCAELNKDHRSYVPSQGNFVMIDVGTDTTPVIAQFAEHGILVGRRFPSMPTFIRVTVGTQDEIEAFVVALRQIVPAPARKAA
ncbi:MAG: histidinol-phosphate transaminase [Candidatus Acidiferrales bacterium]